VDDKLRGAIEKKLKTGFEEQFEKSFRKVFGVTPDIDTVDESSIVHAHGELWALDGHNWLLWLAPDGDWCTATVELLAKEL
jgi:hypothetical protein